MLGVVAGSILLLLLLSSTSEQADAEADAEAQQQRDAERGDARPSPRRAAGGGRSVAGGTAST